MSRWVASLTKTLLPIPDHPGRFKTIHFRHLAIHKHQRIRNTCEGIDGFPAVGRDPQRRPVDLDQELRALGHQGSEALLPLRHRVVFVERDTRGFVRVVDRDFLELNNLQRQVLYDEEDVAQGLPKAIAAAAKRVKL